MIQQILLSVVLKTAFLYRVFDMSIRRSSKGFSKPISVIILVATWIFVLGWFCVFLGYPLWGIDFWSSAFGLPVFFVTPVLSFLSPVLLAGARSQSKIHRLAYWGVVSAFVFWVLSIVVWCLLVYGRL